MGAGWIPFIENKNSFKVSKSPGFKVSNSQSCNASKIQHSISCFLIDIDSVSKVFKNLLNGSSGIFGARLFEVSDFQ